MRLCMVGAQIVCPNRQVQACKPPRYKQLHQPPPSPLEMHLTIIRTSPGVDSYTPLSAFQSETPASFSTPVLHHLQSDCKVLVSSDQTSLIPIFGARSGGGGGVEEVSMEGVDLWVTNECVCVIQLIP